MRTLLLSALVPVVLFACSSQPVEPGPDAGTPDCNPSVEDCSPPAAAISKQINDVRNSVKAEVDLEIDGAVVTYVVSSENAGVQGFFVQAEKQGPGLFVRVNPDDLRPSPERGDRVRFRVRNFRRDPNTRIEVNSISDYERLSQGADVSALVQDLSLTTGLIDTGWQYDGELVRLEGELIHEWIPPDSYIPLEPGLWFAALRARGGFSNSRYIAVVPEKIARRMGDAAFCQFTLDAVPFRTGNRSIELWAFEHADFTSLDCPDAELEEAVAMSVDQVRLTFSRELEPATVQANAFTFGGGLTTTFARVEGRVVHLTTSAQQARADYTVQIGAEVKDVLGNAVAVPEIRRTFHGFYPRARLVLNEINCGGSDGRDLIELRVVEAGSTSMLTLTWDVATSSQLGMFPDTEVEVDDLIVVHLNVDPLRGDAVYSETQAKDEQTASTNYPAAWDFVYDNAQCNTREGVLRVRDMHGRTLDGVALWNSEVKLSELDPRYATEWLRGLQNEGEWIPRTCDGQHCSVTTTPSLMDISVDQKGTRASGGPPRSLSRKPGEDTNRREDWNPAGPMTMGLPNP